MIVGRGAARIQFLRGLEVVRPKAPISAEEDATNA